MANSYPRILIIAGSDSGGGAGIQADIKTVTALGGFAMTAITAITVQNTQGVSGVHPVPPLIIAQQIDAVLSDIGADIVKIGMLHSTEVIETVAASLPAGIPLVLDPVMIATSGDRLLEDSAIEALKSRLIPRATVLTPNLPEAEALTGLKADSPHLPDALRALGAAAVLLKGGHGDDTTLTDTLFTAHGAQHFSHVRQHTRNTHGTGCTLASAIATRLAHGDTLEAACKAAIAYVQQAIADAPGFGKGHGPLRHLV